ncbi:cobalamin-dependent protein [soil metagenome]
MAGKYTVNEVEERTKVPASTLRQWERRYGFPLPERSDSGYRLYSDLDLTQIENMKTHIGDGVPASRAAELVKHQSVVPTGPRASQALTDELLAALIALDEARADEVLSEAHALHTVETVMLELMQGAVNELGERWHRGEVNAATEHFASQYLQGRLRALFSLTPSRCKAAAVIVACAPYDQHELGALMLAVLLKRAGYRIYYVGANTPVADLAEMARTVRATAVMVSASLSASVDRLVEARDHFQELAPVVVFGGAAFDKRPELARSLGGRYLSNDLSAIASQLGALLEKVNL